MNETKENLKALLKNEQKWLWNDLNDDLRSALNGYWSMAAESRVQRIIWIAKIVGFTDWGEIQIPLLTCGVYNAVLAKLDVEPAVFDFGDIDVDQYFNARWIRTVTHIEDMELEDM